MGARLREAAEAGLVLAVKWGVVVLVVGTLLLVVVGDYLAVRRAALQGAAAFSYLQKAEAAKRAKP